MKRERHKEAAIKDHITVKNNFIIPSSISWVKLLTESGTDYRPSYYTKPFHPTTFYWIIIAAVLIEPNYIYINNICTI